MYKMGYIQEHKFSLLYVEDDKTLRDQYKEFFARRVDSFLEATNGKEGLEMFVAYQPDIVVTDLLMPVMDGIEMIQEIKKLSPNTKIIITTAYGDTKYTLSAIDLNVTKYILKPMRGSHLNQIIEEVKELIILQREKEIYKSYIETIINTQPSMVILNKKRDIMIANKIFLEFLGFESLEEFKLNHHCICEFFEIDTDFFHYNKSDWIERALEMINSNKAVEVKIKDEVFSVLVSYIEDKSEYVITLSNITIQKKFELELKKRLDTELEKNKKQIIDEHIEKINHLSNDVSSYIELQLKNKVNIALTLSSNPCLIEALQDSNNYYTNLSNKDKYIKEQNEKWINVRESEPQIAKDMLDKKISNFLLDQKRVLPNTYGEIFLTNKYGVALASTNILSTYSHSYKNWWKNTYNEGAGSLYFDDRGYDHSADGIEYDVLFILIPLSLQVL
jgi:YesN/AraC family two-component response regulator